MIELDAAQPGNAFRSTSSRKIDKEVRRVPFRFTGTQGPAPGRTDGGVPRHVAFNDLVALGLVSALRRVGIAVPEQLSVVGFDDIPFAAFSVPALSTVSVPRRELGAEAWTRLHDTIGGATGGHPLVFRPRFVARDSVAAVPPVPSAQAGWAARSDDTGESTGAAFVASVDDQDVLHLHDGTGVVKQDSPRPFAHPIASLAGRIVTESAPADHPHHLGLSMAVADVDGTSYWGGRTYVAGTGSTMLDNHGLQRVTRSDAAGGTLRQEIEWIGHDGVAQLREARTTVVGATLVPEPASPGATATTALRISVSSAVECAVGEVSIGSPATNGREGAAYGGWFWRMPAGTTRSVLSADGPGEAIAHGSTAAWIAFVLETDAVPDTAPVTLLFRQPARPAGTAFPWFVRSAEYPGIGVSLASTTRTIISPGTPLITGLDVIVVDAALDAEQVDTIHRTLLAADASPAGRNA